MAVGAHAIAKARLEPDDVPLVIGCGPIGLAVIAALKLRGCAPVIAADFSPTRRRLAEHLGADILADPATDSPYEIWHQQILPPDYNPLSLETLMGLGQAPRPSVVF